MAKSTISQVIFWVTIGIIAWTVAGVILLAKWLADYIQEIWMEENGYGDGRVKLRMVKVMETPSNSAMWVASHV